MLSRKRLGFDDFHGLLARLLAVVLFEQRFSQTDGRWRYLDQLILFDIFQGLFERGFADGFEDDVFVARRCADVAQFL